MPSSLPLMVTSVLDKIQSSSDHVDTARVRTLEQLEELLQTIHISRYFILYYMIGSYRIDDKIIYSWCFKFVECFDSASFIAFNVLIKTLESLSSLSSHKKLPRYVISISLSMI